jgi:hypothetical protein
LYPIPYRKIKGVPQGVPTTSFVEEIPEALPTVQGTYPALQKQQLVKEFPESKFPLPSKTTQFHVFTKEPEHPIPTHNLTSLKSPKPESSPSSQANDLVLAIKKLGKMKSDTGKLREPEPFIGKDPKKIKAFIFQCQLYFWNSDFDSDSRKVTFALSYLRMLLRNGLNPVSLDLLMSLWNGLITGKLSWMKSVPTLDLTIKLVMLNMN